LEEQRAESGEQNAKESDKDLAVLTLCGFLLSLRPSSAPGLGRGLVADHRHQVKLGTSQIDHRPWPSVWMASMRGRSSPGIRRKAIGST